MRRSNSKESECMSRGAFRRLLLLCLPVCAPALVVHEHAGKHEGLKTSGSSHGAVPGESAARDNGASAVSVASARRQLRIAIGVLALARDAPQVDTMLRRLTVSQNVPASSILIVVNNITATLEAIGRQYSMAHFEAGCVETRSLVCKSVSLFRRLVTFMPAAHWYTHMSIDCFVVYPNFVAALSRLDSSQRIYTGCANRVTTMAVHMKHRIPKHMRSIPHAGSRRWLAGSKSSP